MKHILLLDHDDRVRMKSGETIEVTPGVLVGFDIQRRIKTRVLSVDGDETPDERKRRRKHEYMKRWRKKNPNYRPPKKTKLLTDQRS